MAPRLKEKYKSEVVPALLKEFNYPNSMGAPRLRKIVLNMGLGEAIQNAKLLDSGSAELGLITGQKPIITRARKSIANFKLRKNMPIGAMVTLRGDRMYEFFDRLTSVALPRVRDFRGLSTRAFDGRGNYTLGLRDQLVFPEVDYAKVEKVKGLNISIVTDARSDAEALALLRHLGMPFRSEAQRRKTVASDEKAVTSDQKAVRSDK
jgi:large subunit ribosomal protein L5